MIDSVIRGIACITAFALLLAVKHYLKPHLAPEELLCLGYNLL